MNDISIIFMEFFKEKKKNLNENDFCISNTIISQIEKKILNDISTGHQKFIWISYPTNEKLLNMRDFEKKLKEEKYKTVLNKKEEMEKKIKAIEEDIKILQIEQEKNKNNLSINQYIEENTNEKEKIKKLMEERKRLEEKRKKRQILEEEKLAQEIAVEKEKELEREKEKKTKRLEKLLEQKKMQREIAIEKEKEILNEILKKQPKFILYEQQDKIKYESELQKRKEALAKMRNIYKPLDKKEFLEHEKWHAEQLEILKKNKENQRENKKDIKVFFSHNYREAEEEYKESIEKEKEKKNNLEKKEKRRKEFGNKLLKENKVKFDKGEIKQLVDPRDKKFRIRKKNGKFLFLKKNAKDQHPTETKSVESLTSEEEEKLSEPSPNKVGLEYLKYAKKKRIKKTINEPEEEDTLTTITYNTNVSKKMILEEIKKNIPKTKKSDKINKVLKSKDMTEKEKIEFINIEINQLEEKAERMEKLEKFKEKKKNDNLGDLYLESIKAKLSLLKEESDNNN